MDYYHGKFGDRSFSHFGSIVRRDKQTHSLHRYTQTDADKRYTPATLVGVSKEAYDHKGLSGP